MRIFGGLLSDADKFISYASNVERPSLSHEGSYRHNPAPSEYLRGANVKANTSPIWDANCSTLNQAGGCHVSDMQF
jgi:hypothetical protein